MADETGKEEQAPESGSGGERPASDASPTAETDGTSGGGRSRKRSAVAAVIGAAAAGTTAVAANRVLKGRAAKAETSSPGGQASGGNAGSAPAGGGEPSLVSRAARRASKKGEPLVEALIETGWDAVKTTVTPAAERAAGVAGRFAATEAPEFVRETLLPPFIEAFEQARAGEGERPS